VKGMPEYSIVSNLSRELWNSFLEKRTVGNFEQCFEYGEISKKAFPRTNVVRLACMRGEEVAGILQGTYLRIEQILATLETLADEEALKTIEKSREEIAKGEYVECSIDELERVLK
jgi:hypothetical protein